MLLFNLADVSGQTAPTSSRVLNDYIHSGLENNLALKGKQLNIEASYLALREARSYYLPSATLLGDYSGASGGRKIQLPLGDLLNPAYKTLNQLTASNNFNMVSNQEVAFLQQRLQDTRIQITVPLINREINYSNRIQKEATNGIQAEINTFKRELVRDIRVAYYTCQQAEKAIHIYKNAESLLKENLRFTEVLLRNNIGIKSNLLSVQAQLMKNTSLQIEAENRFKIASAYFNFLLSRPLNEEIVLAPADPSVQIGFQASEPQGFMKREELSRLNSMVIQSKLLVKKERATGMPQIAAFFNSGMQGSGFSSNNSNKYLVGGIQLKWTLYNGTRTSIKTQQAQNSLKIIQAKLSETEASIEVENVAKALELSTAIAKLNGAKSSLELSKEFYRETQLRYRQGQALALELLDSFTQLINDQMQLEMNQTNVQIKQAEVERSAAGYTL